MKNAPHEGRFFLVPISTDYRDLTALEAVFLLPPASA